MSWRLNDDIIIDEKGNLVCIFLPDTDASIINMIIKGDYAFDLVGEFVETYDAKRKMLKGLFREFCKLTEEGKNYNFKWLISKSGDIEDEQGNIICLFSKKGTFNSKLIKSLPQVFSTIQECVENFKSSSTAKQKVIYEKFCDIYNELLA